MTAEDWAAQLWELWPLTAQALGQLVKYIYQHAVLLCIVLCTTRLGCGGLQPIIGNTEYSIQCLAIMQSALRIISAPRQPYKSVSCCHQVSSRVVLVLSATS